MPKTIFAPIKLKLRPTMTEKSVIVHDLTREELDDNVALMQYLQDYYCPEGFEVTDFTFLPLVKG